jgi:hypothetical protein
VTSWRRIAIFRRITGNVGGNHITRPEVARPTAASVTAQKKIFWPPLNLPTFESSVSYRMYSSILRPVQPLSSGSRTICRRQCAYITSAARK